MGTNTRAGPENLAGAQVHPILFVYYVINKIQVFNKEKKKQKKKFPHHKHLFL